MKKLFAALLLAFACTTVNASETMVATVDDVVVVLEKAPCTHPVVTANIALSIKPQYQDVSLWHAGKALLADITIHLCWIVVEAAPGEVGIVDEQGIVGGMAMSLFAPKEGI